MYDTLHYYENVTLLYYLQINAVEDEEQLRDILAKGCDILQEAGYTRPIHAAKLEKKDAVIGAVALHHCILSIKAELDELVDGIKSTGFLDYIRKFHWCLDCSQVKRLTALQQVLPYTINNSL